MFGRSVFFRFIHLISFFLSCLHFIFWWKFFFENKMRKRYAGDDDYQPTFAYRRNFGQFFFFYASSCKDLKELLIYDSFNIWNFAILQFLPQKYNCRIDFFYNFVSWILLNLKAFNYWFLGRNRVKY